MPLAPMPLRFSADAAATLMPRRAATLLPILPYAYFARRQRHALLRY